ncbi:MAG: T9SS type A sorting domain-containing protein [Crocinitomicaceae bacterium]|nr:T9SS type A sorting domain-containing protein [Crocinitomicaceae bacterium]
MKTIISIITILFSGATQAQAPITQDFESFETWSNTLAGELPDYWDGFNRVIEFNNMPIGDVICIKRDTLDPKDGNYAVEITSESVLGGAAVPGLLTTGDLLIDFNTQTGDIIGGEAFTNTPTHFNGWFKYSPAGIDTAFISIGFLFNSVEILEAQLIIDTIASTWTEFSIPLNFPVGVNPDSVNIVFGSTISSDLIPAGSKLSIDAIEFKYQTANTSSLGKKSDLKIFPIPISSLFTIKTNHETISEIKILDALGRSVFKTPGNTNSINIDASNFQKGTYYVEITTESGRTIETIEIK